VIAWLKVAHIAAIAIWSATLLGLPSLLLAKSHRLSMSETRRLQHILRFGYVHLASPAAVVAIASGIALILDGGEAGLRRWPCGVAYARRTSCCPPIPDGWHLSPVASCLRYGHDDRFSPACTMVRSQQAVDRS
jgi:hypothetical protein